MKGLIFLLIFFSSTHVLAFDYFSKEIDYWKEKSARKQSTIPKNPQQEDSFDWNKYLDPKNDEFFQEGDHKPPAPFMELARNPTDENIKKWFALIEKKNQMMERLQTYLAAYVQKNNSTLSTKEKETIQAKAAQFQPANDEIKRFRFRLYFDSRCPHCERMMASMRALQDKGYYVEVRQTDAGKPSFGIPFPLVRASPKEIKSKKIDATPTLFVADSHKQKLYRINGYHDAPSILQTLSKK